jgi:hypothetical protein
MVHAFSTPLPARLFQVPCLSAVFLLPFPVTIFLTRALCGIQTSSLFLENTTIFLKINNSVYNMVGYLFIILFCYPIIILGNSMQITYFGTVDIPATSLAQ